MAVGRAETWNVTWYVPRSAGGDSGTGHLFGRSKRQASKQPPLLYSTVFVPHGMLVQGS